MQFSSFNQCPSNVKRSILEVQKQQQMSPFASREHLVVLGLCPKTIMVLIYRNTFRVHFIMFAPSSMTNFCQHFANFFV